MNESIASIDSVDRTDDYPGSDLDLDAGDHIKDEPVGEVDG
ncbi:MAG: hypothetical protein ACOC0Z_07625 [Halohasta sp.]